MHGKEAEHVRVSGSQAVRLPLKWKGTDTQWKTLSWVLQKLSFMGLSAALGLKAVCSPVC